MNTNIEKKEEELISSRVHQRFRFLANQSADSRMTGQASRVRNSTLLVSGIWQRPDPFLGEYAVAQHLQHQRGKTEKQWPHSEECGGAEGRLRITPHCHLAGKCTRY